MLVKETVREVRVTETTRTYVDEESPPESKCENCGGPTETRQVYVGGVGYRYVEACKDDECRLGLNKPKPSLNNGKEVK